MKRKAKALLRSEKLDLLEEANATIKQLEAHIWELSSKRQRLQILSAKIGALKKKLKEGSFTSSPDTKSAEKELKDLEEMREKLKKEEATLRPIQRSLPTSKAKNVNLPLPILDNEPDDCGMIYMNH